MNPVQARQPSVAREPPSTRTGITVRPPQVLIINQRDTGESASARQPPAEDAYSRPPVPSVVVYRVESGGHRQTGVIVEVSIDDYRNDRIRRHEATNPEQERELVELTETAGFERVPVSLTHPARAGLRSPVAEVTAGEPDVHRTTADGLTHTIWTREESDLVRAVHDELGGIDALYIADGHHRMAAAHHRMAAAQRRAGRNQLGGGQAFTLAALFPSDEMRVFGYHRCVARPAMSTSDLLASIAAQPVVAQIEQCASAESAHPAPGIVAMYLDREWYRLRLRSLHDPEDVRASLDVVMLDEGILGRALGVAGSPAEITPIPAGEDVPELVQRCSERDAIGFLLHPPGVEQIMSVSDAGKVMPPKSTWFEPKTSAGLFLRDITHHA